WRSEDQADAALGARADGNRNSAGHPYLQNRARTLRRSEAEDRALLQRRIRRSDREQGRPLDLSDSLALPRTGSRRAGNAQARSARPTRSGSLEVAKYGRADSASPRQGEDRRHWQVHWAR